MKTKLSDVMARGAMTRGVITTSINDTCNHIVKLLKEKNISGVCVIGNDGKAVGLISEMDIFKVIGIENWEKMTAESIMTANLETVEPRTTLIEAADIMRNRHVHRLLILSEGGIGMSQKPIGILSSSDIIREASRD